MRITKKLISILLAVLMVLSAVPVAAIAATVNNSTDSAATALKAAMEAYENKMDGSTVFSNMTPAYNAYVDANKAYDAYVYGDASVNLATYASNLTSATEAMTAFNDPKANATVASRDVDTAINSDYAKGLLYADKHSALVDENSSNTKNVRMQMVYSANTVALYNGGDIVIPVFCFWFYDQTGWSSRKVYALYPTNNGTSGRGAADSTEFALQEAWHGSQNGTGDWNSAWSDTNRIGAFKSTMDLFIEGSQNNRNKWNRAANYMKYIGGDKGFSNGLKTVSPGWYALTGYSSKDNLIDHYMTNVGNIYIIDYKTFSAAMASNKAKLANVSKAKQGGMSSVFAAFDTAINSANALYTVNATNVSTVASNLYNAGVGLGNATYTEDSANYQSLRDAMTATKATYNSTSSDKYTTESWNAFQTAYNNAKSLMANLTSTGYNNASTAKTYADALTNAYNSLEVNFVPADVHELTMIIDDASAAIQYKSYFTSSSWAATNFETNVPAAKIDVWGSEANYKDIASIKYTADQQAEVENWSVLLGEAIMQLEISKDATVSSAKGYSINSAIAYADTFNAADYANFSNVTSAVNKASEFYGFVTERNVGAVEAKITEYRTCVEDIIKAINILQPAFSKLANGTVANPGTMLQTRGMSRDEDNQGSYELAWFRNTDQIFFRTSHDATDFDLGGTTFQWITSSDYDNVLDSIALSTGVTATINLTNKNKANNDWGVDPTTLASYPGGLRMSSGSGTINVKNLHVVSNTGNNTNWYIDKSGNAYTSDAGDVTDLLATSEGAAPTVGGVVSNNGTTTIKGDYILTLPKTTAKTLSATTVPTLVSCANSGNFGFLHHYRFYKLTVGSGTEISQYKGYSYGVGSYSQGASVIDISYLMDLFNAVADLNENDYTIDSWNTFISTLEAAKGDMDYGHMTAQEILDECVSRYTSLYNAWKALASPLSNASIKTALGGSTQADALASEIGQIYHGNNANHAYTSASYNAFKDAYATAFAKVFNNGEYSNANIRNIANNAENQAKVDAYATAVTNAYNALNERVDLTALKTAIQNLNITDNMYTVASLQSVASSLASLTYAPLNEEDTYEMGKNEHQAAINAEVNTVNGLKSILVEGDVSAVEAAKQKLNEMVSDPDAWDVEDGYAYIDSIIAQGLYQDVTVLGKTVSGVKYTATDADQIVKTATDKKKDMTYTVYIDGVAHGTYKFGEMTEPINFGKQVDIFYAYVSKVTSNVKLDENRKPLEIGKYFTRDSVIDFVVKGDTYLTTHAVKNEDTSTHKVTFINDVTNRIISVDYVEDGATIGTPKQPVLPFYQALGYINVDGTEFNPLTPITQDTVIYAHYAEKTKKEFTVTYTDSTSTFNYTPVSYTKAYDDLITLTRDDAMYWAVFDDEDAFNIWLNGEGDIQGKERIMFYGNTYSFRVHENTYIVSLSQDDFDFDVDAGFITVDQAKTVYAKSSNPNEIIYTDNKFSIVGTYALPDDYKLVETGLLFAKNNTAALVDIKEVDNVNVYRLKSTKQTEGNKFVISITSTNIAEGQQMRYTPYIIYRDDKGELQTYICSNVKDMTFTKTTNA